MQPWRALEAAATWHPQRRTQGPCAGSHAPPLPRPAPSPTVLCRLYLQLQRLYRAKADSDAAAVEAHARTILARLGRPADSLPPAELRLFCKNARNIRVVRWVL